MRAAAHRNRPTFRKIWWVLVALLLPAGAWATPQVTAIGPDLYAYISDNDGSANSTFLVGSKGILVVDTGLTPPRAANFCEKSARFRSFRCYT